MKRLFVLAGLLVLLAFPALAQQQTNTGVPVLQNATRNDAATFLYGPAAGAACGTTISQTAVLDTVTVPAQPNLTIYITSISFDITFNTTGATTTNTISATNLTGAPFWSQATLVGAAANNGGIHWSESYPTGLKATQPGVAVTLVPSGAQTAGNFLCMRVAGFYAN